MNKDEQLALIHELNEFKQHFDDDYERPNLFVAAGLSNQEIRHSSILGFLLDPNGWHGLGDTLLRFIVAESSSGHPDAIDIAFSSLDDATVARELACGGEKNGRIDLFVKSKRARLSLTIENKVGATQSEGQLKRYREWVEKTHDHGGSFRHLFVYLTLDPQDEPDDDGWLSLTYADIVDFLKNVLNTRPTSLSDLGKIYIEQYIDLVDLYIMKNHSSEEADFCLKLWQNYGGLLKTVMEFEPTPVKDAFNTLKDQGSSLALEVSGIKSDTCVFLPEEILKKLRTQTITGGGWGWPKDGYPLQFFFKVETKPSGWELTLNLYVGPVGNRDIWINHLRKAGLESKIGKKNSNKYTHIWGAKSVTFSTEQVSDAEELVSEMKKLYDQATKDGVIQMVCRAIDEVSTSTQTS